MTSDLDTFLAAMAVDDNEWWRVSCGDHLNLFEDAVDRMKEAEARMRAARNALAAVAEVRDARREGRL